MLYPVEVGDSQWGYIDQHGTLIIAGQYSSADSFADGLAHVERGTNDLYINMANEVVLSFPSSPTVGYGPFSEGRATYLSGNGVGYIDRTGESICHPVYGNAGEFREGLAAVSVADATGRPRYGYLATDGKLAIDCRFKMAGDFSEGLAAAMIENHWGYINESGRWAIKPQFIRADDFSEERAAVVMKSDRLSRFFINKSGEATPESNYGFILSFSEGLAPVTHTNESAIIYIDREGREVLRPKGIDKGYEFSCGLAQVEIQGKVGFIDKTGTLVIDPQWSGAGDFDEYGVAEVKVKGHRSPAYINMKGLYIWNPEGCKNSSVDKSL